MIDRGTCNLLGVGVSAVDYEAAVARIIEAAKSRRPYPVTALAVHGVMTGVHDLEHRHRLNRFALVVPDGQPVRWALNLLHRVHLPDRVYGPTLTLECCRAAAEFRLPVYFYGSRQEVVEKLAENLSRRFPGLAIAGIRPSRFRQLTVEERDEVVSEIRGSGAALTFVGLGCPRQEVWAYEMAPRLSMPALAVGAAFDFHAGTLPQAPAKLQRAGLEWAFRLWQEPRRLWKRYLLLNPEYVARVALQALGLYTAKPNDITPPSEEIRCG